MPPEPSIAPPIPTVTQPAGTDNSPGLEQVQRAFDQIYPERANKRSTAQTEAPPAPPDTQPAPIPPPPDKPPVDPEAPPAEPPAAKLPSFLEEALRVDTDQPAGPIDKPDLEDFPEELPPEERKSRIKGLRDAYKRLKGEVETLRTKPAQDEATIARMAQLERQNQEMGQVLTRMGVETHQDFQRNIIQPMTVAWQQAAQIVKDAGGDKELARAVSLQGKAHFEALDEVFTGLPESAKLEAHQAIANYKRMDQARQQALANAPKTFEALHKKDLERQYQNVTEQRNEMKKLFQEAGRKLREVAKVEVLQKSDDPDAKWWNSQADEIEQNANNLYMENTDMEKMAFATWLAPMADVYRKLWLTERMAHQKTAKSLKEHFGAEPYIGEGGGGEHGAGTQMEADLKQPFSQVFLREFHRAQARNR